MIEYIIELVILSILVSLFANWVKLIPRYPKKRYRVIQEIANAGLMSLFLIVLFNVDVHPSWIILFFMILFILWVSVKFTDNLIKRNSEVIQEKTPDDKGDRSV
jgi:hypothetical protein